MKYGFMARIATAGLGLRERDALWVIIDSKDQWGGEDKKEDVNCAYLNLFNKW